jgi:Integrase core domain.
MAALEEAFEQYGAPEIFNTDQGCQFTSFGFTGLLKDNGVRISMDGRGCRRDNIMVERLWRTLKYENIYLHAYETRSEARSGIGAWLYAYNTKPGPAILGGCPPHGTSGRREQSFHRRLLNCVVTSRMRI